MAAPKVITTNVSSVPSGVGATARVMPENMTRLYGPNGAEAWCLSESVPAFLAIGFVREKVDPIEALSGLVAAARALVPAVENLQADFGGDGETYAANLEVAYAAIINVNEAWATLGPILFGNPEPAPGVKMVLDGQMVEVDPGQVELYKTKGYVLAAE